MIAFMPSTYSNLDCPIFRGKLGMFFFLLNQGLTSSLVPSPSAFSKFVLSILKFFKQSFPQPAADASRSS